MLSALAVIVAGGLGAVSRALIELLGQRAARPPVDASTHVDRRRIPWTTTVINISGSLAAGSIAGAVATGGVAAPIATVVALGYLGAFTTFSTAMMQTVDLASAGAPGRALVHALLPLAGSVTAAAIGWALVVA